MRSLLRIYAGCLVCYSSIILCPAVQAGERKGYLCEVSEDSDEEVGVIILPHVECDQGLINLIS
jgi:hypothetical protein